MLVVVREKGKKGYAVAFRCGGKRGVGTMSRKGASLNVDRILLAVDLLLLIQIS